MAEPVSVVEILIKLLCGEITQSLHLSENTLLENLVTETGRSVL